LSTYCNRTDLRSESDVEQKLLYRVITDPLGLAFDNSEVWTKTRLRPLDIDKGAGRKVGYYPDYVIFIASIPVLVVEAKSPEEKAESGYREAQLYALELNKAFPERVNPVTYVISCNGEKLIFGSWDAQPSHELSFEEVQPAGARFEEVRQLCCRMVLLEHALSIRAKLIPGYQYRPLSMFGSPAAQNAELARNTFASDLVPILGRYFGDDVKEDVNVLREAYVSSNQITGYNKVLENLLRDNLAIRRSVGSEIETTKTAAADFQNRIKAGLGDYGTASQVLVIGGVGVGKTLFVERFYHFLRDEELANHSAWSVIDFNKAPNDLDRFETWICEEFLREFPVRNQIPDFLSREHLDSYFSLDLAVLSKGPYEKLRTLDPVEYERKIADELATLLRQPEKLAFGCIRSYQTDRGVRVVVVFDNVDRLDLKQQLKIFQTAQWFRSMSRCFTIISLRDETYDRFKREPPLDAIPPLFVFRVSPPRFLDVAKRRVLLALNDLSRSMAKTREYTLPSGATVQYAGTRLGEFLFNVYVALFNPKRSLRLLLEAIAGRNVRNALRMFTDILISGHLREDRIFTTTLGKTSMRLPEWLILRILMRTKYRHFADDHGYIVNLFGVDPNSRSTSNYILVDCLDLLAAHRKRVGELGIEGYVWTKRVVEGLLESGYAREDVFWALEKLLNNALIVAQHLRTTGVSGDDYIKISASGFFHLKFVLCRMEYLAAVATDCWYRDKSPADEVLETMFRDHDEMKYRMKMQRVLILEQYMIAEAERVKAISQREPRAARLVAAAFAQSRTSGVRNGTQADFDFE